MREANYLKKGQCYIFHQSLDSSHKPLMKFYDLGGITIGDLKEENKDCSGGYTIINKRGVVEFRNSKSLGMEIDLVLLDLYRERKKDKFKHLKFA